ncbi:MAG: SusD/RagB family nutrient-binding outer membrane lipoprotein, partial [Bacteroidaceae bacterium]|nr:SusD/RagB family nutrient-binding outer membrane lipoprotein [Bacteroidaceae bacterium]
MKRYIYNKVSLLLLTSALSLLSSCYDLTEMSHNPYEIEGNDGAANGEVINVDDDTKYADINLSYAVTAEDSAYWKEHISAVPNDLRSFLYQSYYSQYQRATNLTHDIYSG